MTNIKDIAIQSIYDSAIVTINNMIALQLNHVDMKTTTEQKLKNVDSLQRVRKLLDEFYNSNVTKESYQ
ncbi:hypothetical protein R4036_004585 [Salmonella enterica]|nr:hypothetical protein [Salmonella enterica]